MTRMKKEKGRSARPAPGKPRKSSDSPANASDVLLKKQVLALGGTQEDIDLMHSAGKQSFHHTTEHDTRLSKEVSAFLKDLNLGGGERQATNSQVGKVAKKSKINLQRSSGSTARTKEQTNAPESSNVVISGVGQDPGSQRTKQRSTTSTQRESRKPTKKEQAKPKDAAEHKTVAEVELPVNVAFAPKSNVVFQPTSLWHAVTPPLPPLKEPLPPVTPNILSSLTHKASSLHSADTRAFQSSSSSSSEANFLSNITQSGTLSDRLSALTLLVQSSPVHNTKSLETLKEMAERGKGKGGREESLKALRCVVDWWVGGGAPDRKLRYFRDQPLNHPSVTDEHLLIWYFEDWLKKYFFSILQVLETLSLDPLQYVRMQSLALIFTLLRDKPEQEQNLLRLLVNKLGDTEKAPCSRASYHLLNLLQTHPSMKGVVVREIIALVLRPSAPPAPTSAPTTARHIRFTDAKPKSKTSKPSAATSSKIPGDKKGVNPHARYYATITLNQVVLTPGDREVALQLMDVYFEMFKELLGTEAQDDEEEEHEAVGEVRKDKKGRVIAKDGKGKNKRKVTEVKGAGGFAEVDNVHSKLISAILTGVNRALPFARVDAGDAGLNKHIDTLFKITHTSTFNISLQALVLIQQITASLVPPPKSAASSVSKSITDRYYRTLYDSLHDTRLASSSKQAMYLNLLFKSIKADAGNADGERVKALVRRFLQVLVSGGGGATEFVAGGLYLLGELFSTIPGLRSMINEPQKEDVENYDSRKRDPRYAHASSTPLWELVPLLYHYHPAISLHARQLLTSQPLTASADLSQNTLSHFLDRFVYKNPKKAKQDVGKAKGASAMQPAASGTDGTGVKLMKGEVEDAVLMNEKDFLKKRVEEIPVDQVFYHRYFTRKDFIDKAKAAKAEKRRGQGAQEADNEDKDEAASSNSEKGHGSGASEEESNDEDEAEIWKAMKASIPKGSGLEDVDLLEEDESEFPSGLDMDDSDEQGESNDEEDEDEVFSLAERSDDEDLVSLNSEVPDGLVEWDGSDSDSDNELEDQDNEWGGMGGDSESGVNKKRKREVTAARDKRKKLKSLPTFASYEDYAKMIEDGPEDDI